MKKVLILTSLYEGDLQELVRYLADKNITVSSYAFPATIISTMNKSSFLKTYFYLVKDKSFLIHSELPFYLGLFSKDEKFDEIITYNSKSLKAQETFLFNGKNDEYFNNYYSSFSATKDFKTKEELYEYLCLMMSKEK